MFEIGNSLREARLRQQLRVLLVLEERTKVRPKYLRALEDEEFSTSCRLRRTSRASSKAYADALGLTVSSTSTSSTHDSCRGGGGSLRPKRNPSTRAARRVETSAVSIAVVAIGLVAACPSSPSPSAAARRGDDHSTSRSSPRSRRHHRPVQDTGSRSPPWCSPRPRGHRLEVHALSVAGPILFQGTLLQGRSQRFAGRRIWVSASTPANLDATVNGVTNTACRANRTREPDLRPARPADRLDAPPRRRRRDRQRARPRRDRRDAERQLPRDGGRTARLRPEPDRRRRRPSRRAAGGSSRRLLEAPRASSPAGSADPTTARSSSSPRSSGAPLELRPELEAEIGAVSRAFAARRGRDYVEFEPGVRKQATLPAGAFSLGLAGTAPGFVQPTAAGSRSSCRGRPASCGGSGRARSRAAFRALPGPHRGARAAHAALLRARRVVGRPGVRARRRRRRRRRGDDLRAGVRDPRRPARLAGRGGEGRCARGGARVGARAVPLLARRASGRADRRSISAARRWSRSGRRSRAPGGLSRRR